MASAWHRVKSLHQWILDNGDKRTDPWLLVYSPVPVFCIFLCYLAIIWLGPKLMRNRKPLDLKLVLIVYNFAMVCLSVYMFHEFLVTSWLSDYSYLCQPVDYSSSPLARRMASVCWWFFFSKVIELSDTVFFILRKKNSQLTFLHVYHHGTMIFNWWAGVNILHWAPQHIRTHHHVFVLWSGSFGSTHAEISVVETLPHLHTTAAVRSSHHTHRLQPVHRV
ncbi:ELOVL fatty acid elongase 8b isoform X2 [Neoarius graeffei]|uniref:ELOVL fatty acid elongase 8b isoform X2 n=1 Tax=Neoarius graeffei TaxID=443677 RepID=UPI00298BD4C3|nr:ELOVL fatty acid elongase 8b isoform X2 [Neoarius graeffei]